MKVWITRPSIWDCIVKGIGRCELWFLKPQFDHSARGNADIEPFKGLPVGWVALDDSGLNARGDCSIPLGKLLEDCPAIEQDLWNAIGISIEGRVPDSGWPKRWEKIDSAGTDSGEKTFIFECDLPPLLWFRIAAFNGHENTTWGARHYRSMLSADVPF